ncbi:MAG: beta-hexosaminidase [Clostridia bacterium]|nr:beta-hexosaminidase [Clostridia bacterium]
MNELLQTMSTPQKAGQLFLIRCPQENEAASVACFQPAGLALFSVDFENRTAAECLARVSAMQEAALIPLLVAADEEGGTVCRVSRQPALRAERFPSPRALYAAGGWEALEADAAEKCLLLRQVGVNVNLAPVCDLSDDPEHFIYPRAVSGDPDTASSFVKRVVKISEAHGVGTVLKHFPGYGGNADTHVGSSVDKRPLSRFRAADLKPFAAGVAAGSNAIMMSHNIVSCLDRRDPASLSPRLHAFLRAELKFDGVILTDDLQMDAVSQYWDEGEAAVRAVLAGNDLLCASRWETQIPAVIRAAESGALPQARLDEAVLRVLRWKKKLGLLETVRP